MTREQHWWRAMRPAPQPVSTLVDESELLAELEDLVHLDEEIRAKPVVLPEQRRRQDPQGFIT